MVAIIEGRGDNCQGPVFWGSVSFLLKQPPLIRGRERFPLRTGRVKRKSGFALTKCILKAANSRAVSWTIGSKRNANLNAGCFGSRSRASG
jgi:hypothetical protein